MEILNIIVHEVRKAIDKTDATVFKKPEENSIDDKAIRLSKELSDLFRKTGLNIGQFIEPENPDDPIPHFVTLLKKYFKEMLFSDFLSFTHAAADDFKTKLTEAHPSKGGYLWFNHYTHNQENFLSVVLLREKPGFAISDSLTFDEVDQIDLDKLHMAARINLTAWTNKTSNRYIAFRIGKDAKDVTTYFTKFIGCEEYTQAKLDTKKMIEVTKRYCALHGLEDEKTESVKQFVHDQCIAWLDENIPVTLDKMSELLDNSFQPKEEGKFLEIAQGEPYLLKNEIAIERSSLRGLTRYTGKNKKMSISFDSDQLNVSVIYNEDENTLLIKDPPTTLVAQIKADSAKK